MVVKIVLWEEPANVVDLCSLCIPRGDLSFDLWQFEKQALVVVAIETTGEATEDRLVQDDKSRSAWALPMDFLGGCFVHHPKKVPRCYSKPFE